jgi:hypothetical protein
LDLNAGLKRYSIALLLGAVSAVFYGTVALAPVFLVPIQVSGVGRGIKSMFVSSAVSIAGIALWQMIIISKAGVFTWATMALGISAPLALLIALALMAMHRFHGIPFAIKALVGSMVAAALCMPSFIFALRDSGLRRMFEDAFMAASTAIGAEMPDPELLWDTVKTGVASSFAAILFVFLFASAWIGTRFGQSVFHIVPSVPPAEQQGVADDGKVSLPPVLAGYRLPEPLVWALLASWASLLFARFYPSFVLSAVASNATLALSICYGVQGLAVASAVAERAGMAPVARLLGPIAIILLLLGGTVGLILVGLIALVGTLETWIPFRAVAKGEKP